MGIRKLITPAVALALLVAPATAKADIASRTINIDNNYAWFIGSVTWSSSYFNVSGWLNDTPQRPSNSWARVAYKQYYGGAWHQKYATPDPWKVSNGHEQTKDYQRENGTFKEVWVDLCSKRQGKSYCTGWS